MASADRSHHGTSLERRVPVVSGVIVNPVLEQMGLAPEPIDPNALPAPHYYRVVDARTGADMLDSRLQFVVGQRVSADGMHSSIEPHPMQYEGSFGEAERLIYASPDLGRLVDPATVWPFKVIELAEADGEVWREVLIKRGRPTPMQTDRVAATSWFVAREVGDLSGVFGPRYASVTAVLDLIGRPVSRVMSVSDAADQLRRHVEMLVREIPNVESDLREMRPADVRHTVLEQLNSTHLRPENDEQQGAWSRNAKKVASRTAYDVRPRTDVDGTDVWYAAEQMFEGAATNAAISDRSRSDNPWAPLLDLWAGGYIARFSDHGAEMFGRAPVSEKPLLKLDWNQLAGPKTPQLTRPTFGASELA